MARVSRVSRISVPGRRLGAHDARRSRRIEGARRLIMPGTLARRPGPVNKEIPSPPPGGCRHERGPPGTIAPRYPPGQMPGPSYESLKRFFESAPAARKATRTLARDARVNLALAGGTARFTMESGSPPGAGRPPAGAGLPLPLTA